MSGPRFFDYHLLLGERADQILAMTDDIAERARKIGRTTIQLKRIADNEPNLSILRTYGVKFAKMKRDSQ
jgi:DNA-binding ferritin-like protein